MGSRTGSTMHQHAPPGSQAKDAPQRAQVVRGSARFSGEASIAALCTPALAGKRPRNAEPCPSLSAVK
jgi:hypothetical protein